MCTVAIGRKTFLFCRSHHAVKQMATFYTLLATCRLHGVNPVKWLEDVLPRIAAGHPAKEIHLLLPHQWQPLHPSGASIEEYVEQDHEPFSATGHPYVVLHQRSALAYAGIPA